MFLLYYSAALAASEVNKLHKNCIIPKRPNNSNIYCLLEQHQAWFIK